VYKRQALYFTGNAAGALADINFIRRHSGAVAGRAAFATDSAFVAELLLQRRYSLLWEGHRWADVRRFTRMFNTLVTLPLDAPTHFRQIEQPVPQAECLQRAGLAYPMGCAATWPIPAP